MMGIIQGGCQAFSHKKIHSSDKTIKDFDFPQTRNERATRGWYMSHIQRLHLGIGRRHGMSRYEPP